MATKKELEAKIERLKPILVKLVDTIHEYQSISTERFDTMKDIAQRYEDMEMRTWRITEALSEENKVLSVKVKKHKHGPKALKERAELARVYFAERFRYHYDQSKCADDRKRRNEAAKAANIETYKRYPHKNPASNGGYWSANPLNEIKKLQP